MIKLNTNQIGAIALILIFILSTFAVYFGAYNSSSQKEVLSQSKIISGYATANATLVSYSPVLEVENTTPAVLDAIKQLKSEQRIIQQIKTSQILLITLKDSADAPYIMRVLEPLGATVYAQATIKTGPLNFVSNSTSMLVNSTNYVSKMQPIFEQGEQFAISLQASVYEGELFSYSYPTIQTESTFNAWVPVKDAKVLSSKVEVLIPWENRQLDFANFKSSLDDPNLINYNKKSFILFSQALNAQALQQLSMSKPSYILSLQPTSFSIDPSFSDSQKIVSDLSQFNVSVQFPPSILSFDSQNQSEIANMFLSQFNESNATLSNVYSLQLTMENSFVYNNKNYTMPSNSVVVLDSQYEPSSEYGVIISASSISNKVVSYNVISYMPNIFSDVIQSPSDDLQSITEPLSEDLNESISDTLDIIDISNSSTSQNDSNSTNFVESISNVSNIFDSSTSQNDSNSTLEIMQDFLNDTQSESSTQSESNNESELNIISGSNES